MGASGDMKVSAYFRAMSDLQPKERPCHGVLLWFGYTLLWWRVGGEGRCLSFSADDDVETQVEGRD